MTSMTYRILKTSRFKNLYSWSVLNATPAEPIFSGKYNLVKIGSLLRKSKNTIIINDDKTYKRVTVKLYGGGVKLRDEVLGKEIKTKRQFVLKEGQFLYSRIDARNGAFGLAGKEVDNAIVSNEFPIYDVDTGLVIPEFLVLITSSKPFYDFCQSLSSGSTGRQRIDESSFLSFKVPLPDISIQTRIVEQHKHNITTAQEAENEANELEKQIEKYLFSELGIEKPKTVEKKEGLQFVSFKNLSRWDFWNNSENYCSIKHKNTILEDVVLEKPQYGANSKAIKKKSDFRYIRITDLNEDGTLNDDIVSADKIESQYILQNNDFLIARSGATVGKTFLYKNEFGKSIYAGYLIRYKLDESKIIPEYLLHFTKSEIYKNWILKNQRISAQPNINGQEFLKSILILPPLDTQAKIVRHISAQKEKIKSLRQQAEELRKQAKEAFENEIFA